MKVGELYRLIQGQSEFGVDVCEYLLLGDQFIRHDCVLYAAARRINTWTGTVQAFPVLQNVDLVAPQAVILLLNLAGALVAALHLTDCAVLCFFVLVPFEANTRLVLRK